MARFVLLFLAARDSLKTSPAFRPEVPQGILFRLFRFEEFGSDLKDLYTVGDRVIVGAITPCGQCFSCLNGCHSQCGGALGGWQFGNTINGASAEYLLVPDAKANLAPIPRSLADEDVVIAPTCLVSANERRG